MRPRILVFALITAAAAQQAPPPPGNDDPVIRAMRAEVDRSKGLRVIDIDVPYFIQYTLNDASGFGAQATLGALISSNTTRFRLPNIEVRVGSYDFDNTGHVFSGLSRLPRLDPEQWPLDDDEAYLRSCLWLATDRAYKVALESISRKRASLKNLPQQSERLPDFLKATPVTYFEKPPNVKYDPEQWKKRTAELSAVFRAYPEILSSGVESQILTGKTYQVNSEGTALRTNDLLNFVRARAEILAPDGTLLRDAVSFQSLAIEQLPPQERMRDALVAMAEGLKALAKAPAGEAYTGPVLFEPRAAAQLLAQLLGDHLRIQQRPVSEPNRPVPILPSDLEGRLGARIVPEWLEVIDDPTLREWNGKPVSGSYEYDMEGVPGRRVAVTEKGVLKNFLLTRTPVKGFSASNGHARFPGGFGQYAAAISNLIIEPGESAPMEDLKKKLIEAIQTRSKPYGLLIRKLDYPSSASPNELRNLLTTAGGVRPVSSPLYVYRVYPDGREELVRGLRFRGLTSKALKDILAASREREVFEFINNVAPFAAMSGGGFLAPATVISPGLLIDDLELDKAQGELLKTPLVPPPTSSN